MAYRAIVLTILLLTAGFMLAQSDTSIANSPLAGARAGNDAATANRRDIPDSLGEINGSVRTLDDRPVADARVELHTFGSAVVLGSVYSNGGGSFALQNVPMGEYEVVARSGLTETRERVDVQGMKSFVTLRLPENRAPGSSASGPTVSVTQMQIPEKAQKAYTKGREAFGNGKLDEARKEAATALKIAPDYADGLMLRGMIALQMGQFEDGRADLERAIESDPNDGMAFVVLGSAYNALHRYDDALRVLDRGESLVPNSWQVYFEQARALISKHAFAQGLRALEKARQFQDHDFPVMHLVKANALLGLHQYPEAQVELQAYLDRQPHGDNAEQARHVLEQLQAATATASTHKQ